jgi:hypothetical protein
MSRVYGWLVAVAVLVAALFSLHRSSQRAGRDAERVRIAEEQAELALIGYRLARSSVEAAQAKTIAAERDLAKLRKIGKMAIDSANSTVAAARQVLQDSASTADTLRHHLRAVIADNETLAFQFRAYLAQDSVVHYSWGVERAASDSAFAAANRAMLAKDGVIRALRKASECKVLFFRCPTRSQVLVTTALVTAGVLTLARD